jgi:hypothetical protein
MISRLSRQTFFYKTECCELFGSSSYYALMTSRFVHLSSIFGICLVSYQSSCISHVFPISKASGRLPLGLANPIASAMDHGSKQLALLCS